MYIQENESSRRQSDDHYGSIEEVSFNNLLISGHVHVYPNLHTQLLKVALTPNLYGLLHKDFNPKLGTNVYLQFILSQKTHIITVQFKGLLKDTRG